MTDKSEPDDLNKEIKALTASTVPARYLGAKEHDHPAARELVRHVLLESGLEPGCQIGAAIQVALDLLVEGARKNSHGDKRLESDIIVRGINRLVQGFPAALQRALQFFGAWTQSQSGGPKH